MKESSPIRASHVNTGTEVERGIEGRLRKRGREFRHGKLQVEVESSETTATGGLSLAVSMARFVGLAQALDRGLSLLKQYRPYRDSDHILTHVYNLFCGGSCIEDISSLQGSEPLKRLLGAENVPDPTTAGDFLRRFDEKSLNDFNNVIDTAHRQVWRKACGRKKTQVALVDIDSSLCPLYGKQKEGADFTYKKGYGYHPIAITLAKSGEVLRVQNRPGNVSSPDGAAILLEEVMPLLTEHHREVIVRGDSAFATQEIVEVCEDFSHYFAIVSPERKNFPALARSIPEEQWQPFGNTLSHTPPKSKKKGRKRKKNLRRATARARGKRDLKLQKQWVTEIPYQPQGSDQEYRLIIRRQRIEESAQGRLFTLYRYRYVLSNLPKSKYSTVEVTRLTYQRCDQENVIEQLKNGISAMAMPCSSFLANAAFLVCARLAHNLKAWLAMLALPNEAMRWEWKRFRNAFVYFSAKVVKSARQTILKIADAHRFTTQIVTALQRLQV